MISKMEKAPPPPKNFPYKHTLTVMGNHLPDFPKTILNMLKVNGIGLSPEDIAQKLSAKGTYISLTITIEVQSQKQLETIYQALHNSHLVKYLL
jgi:uncharacterized protein